MFPSLLPPILTDSEVALIPAEPGGPAMTPDWVKSLGATPFLIPAMGSHGGAVAEGQLGILKSLGISSRFSPAPVERNFIDDWTKKFGFDESIIIEACNRAITARTDANFPYVNGILTSWHEKGVKKLADIRKLDEEYSTEKAAKKKTSGTSNNSGVAAFASSDESAKKRQDKYSELEKYYLNEG